jgi:hypothetical protein
MKSSTVGVIKNIIYNDEDQKLDIIVRIINNKFKKKLLRDLALSGMIKFDGNKLIYLDSNEEQ